MAARRRGKRVQHSDGSVTVHGRNPNGEGSVYREADGRWVATWREPGWKRPRKATAKTRDEAIRRRADRQGKPVSDDRVKTMADMSDWWLHHVHKGAVSASSWAKAEDRVNRITRTLGHLLPAEVTYPVVVEWQSGLLSPKADRDDGSNIDRGLAPKTVKLHRQTLAQIMDEAVKLEQAPGNPVRSVDPPKDKPAPKVALTDEQVAALMRVAPGTRLGAAAALLFLHGWRVSEVLGLAWEDLDLEKGTAKLQQVSVYVDGVGQRLQPWAKADGAHGVHWLAPTTVSLLKERQQAQEADQATARKWDEQRCEGRKVNLVFTTNKGGLILRQTVTKELKKLGKAAEIDPELIAEVATHTGRRTVVTVMYEGGVPIDDIARHVGHALPATTAGYVKRLGQRPQKVAARAAALLDPGAKAAAG